MVTTSEDESLSITTLKSLDWFIMSKVPFVHRKKNVPTFTKTSSAMPVGVEIVRIRQVQVIIPKFWSKSGRLSSFQYGRYALGYVAPRSSTGKHSFNLLNITPV
ncbi:hypothetical protein Tco_0368284 [Tanacetum coccineum]